MVSFVYYSFLEDCLKGNINAETDTFKGVILGTGHTPSKSHTKRSSLTADEVSSSGTGYPAGGPAIDLSVSRTGGTITINIPTVQIAAPVTSIVGRYVGVYKARGGADTADELCCLLDPGTSVSANGTTYTIGAQGPITITVP